MKKGTVIIVGDYNRTDFLYIAQIIHQYYDIYFLEYTHKAEITSEQYKEYGQSVFWGQYKNALAMIDQIKPNMVLFYFIESFNHVALNVACKFAGVKTFHIEHGIRNYEVLEANLNQIIENEKPSIGSFVNKLNNLKSRIKNRLFFQRTVRALPKPYKCFLEQYFQVRSSKSVFETFKEINNPLRVADTYISFSPKIFEFHQKSDYLPQGYPVHFIGCPSFDYLAEVIDGQSGGTNILFIDNAFETQHLFGWDESNKIKFLSQLVNFAVAHNKQLYIKPHPYTVPKVYEAAKQNKRVTFIGSHKSFIESIIDTQVVIGFYSTLLMPLMALKNTVCFSLEMHPLKLKKEPSAFLVNTGATKRIATWEELKNAFDQLDQIHNDQKQVKNKFLKNWLYKFDGQSTERLKSVLLDEVS